MTDLLLKPDDTGDIPAVDPVGDATRNLSEYARHLPPTNVLRRHDVTVALPLVEPGQPKPPPLPAPTPTGEVVWETADPSEDYLGKHRRPSRWDWLTVPLAIAWQRIVGAM